MDPEAPIRKKLIGILGQSFACREEVWLKRPTGERIKCDVLVRPKEEGWENVFLAFECKRPSQDWHYKEWARAVKQAADNVGAVVEDAPDAPVVSASFIYPAPFVTPSTQELDGDPLIRPGYENAIAGIFHLALMFRVGRAGLKSLTNVSYFSIALGPNEIWNERVGFTENAISLLRQKRPVGSQMK